MIIIVVNIVFKLWVQYWPQAKFSYRLLGTWGKIYDALYNYNRIRGSYIVQHDKESVVESSSQQQFRQKVLEPD